MGILDGSEKLKIAGRNKIKIDEYEREKATTMCFTPELRNAWKGIIFDRRPILRYSATIQNQERLRKPVKSMPMDVSERDDEKAEFETKVEDPDADSPAHADS